MFILPAGYVAALKVLIILVPNAAPSPAGFALMSFVSIFT